MATSALVVEDEPDIRNLIVFLLADLRYEDPVIQSALLDSRGI